jgi:mono/diheme cytochrome c family protein
MNRIESSNSSSQPLEGTLKKTMLNSWVFSVVLMTWLGATDQGLGVRPAIAADSEMVTAKEAGPDAGRKPPFDLAEGARIDAGKALYMRTCAGYCHGGDGAGGRAPSFKNRDDLDPSYAYKTIVNGRVASDVMPVFGHTFSSDQVWELVAYLKFLGSKKD